MNSNVYDQSNAARLESEYLGLVANHNIKDCKYLVNPSWDNLVNKRIIINSPLALNFDKLSKFNRIESRIVINCLRYDLIPYKVESSEVTIGDNPSLMILNKHILQDNTKLESSYLLGTEVSVGEHLTAVGYTLLTQNK